MRKYGVSNFGISQFLAQHRRDPAMLFRCGQMMIKCGIVVAELVCNITTLIQCGIIGKHVESWREHFQNEHLTIYGPTYGVHEVTIVSIVRCCAYDVCCICSEDTTLLKRINTDSFQR